MADTDTQVKPQTENQVTNPLVDSPVGNYRLKRLHPDASAADLRNFFEQLDGIHEDSYVSANFGTLFQNTTGNSLRYTKDTYFSGKHDATTTLFRSELALIFYDWLYHQPDLRQRLADVLKERSADERVFRTFEGILRHCQNIGEREWVTVNEGEEKQFDDLLSGDRAVSTAAKFIIDYIDHPPEKKTEEELTEAEKETQQAGGVAAAVAAGLPTAGVPSKPGEQATTEGGEPGAPPTEPSQPVQPITPTEPTISPTNLLFNPDVLRETARFTQISLIQLEKFHNLPEGTLQNSPELRSILTQKIQGFLATTLPADRFDKILQDPKERLKLIREFQWLVLNDTPIKIELARSLDQAVKTTPALKAQLEEEIAKAQRGEQVSELTASLANDPVFVDVIKNLKAANPLFAKSSSEIKDALTKELIQKLKDAGVQTDRLGLATETVIARISSFLDLGINPGVMDHISEQNFALLFSEYIPYNPQLIEFFKEYLVLKKSVQGRENNQLYGQELAAIKEAQALFDAGNPNITPQQAEANFQQHVLLPTNQLISLKRATKVPLENTFEENKNLSEEWAKNYHTYLQDLWQEFLSDKKKVAGFQRFVGYETVTLEVPQQEFVIYLNSAQAGEGIQLLETGLATDLPSTYVPDNARILSPLAGMAGFGDKVNKLNQLAGLAQGAGGLLNRFKGVPGLGGGGAQNAQEQLLATGAGIAGSAYGGPIGKWLAENLATQKGREKLKNILVATGVGGGALFLLPMTTTLGRLGMSVAGPVGGWIGMGLQSFLGGLSKSIFGSGSAGAGGGGGSIAAGGAAVDSLGGGSGVKGSIYAGGGGTGGVGGGGIGTGTLTGAQAGGVASTGGLAAIITSTGAQAVIATVGLVAVGTIFTNTTLSNALLADFPQVGLLGTTVPGTQAKQSEYVTIEKRVFITGCPENKCENPAFPIKAEYSIVIRPKDDYTVILREVTDTLRVNHSDKSWEEEGKTPPNIPERIKTIEAYPELYGGQTIAAGTEFAFSYTENFDANYNHASILNTFELKFDYSTPDSDRLGSDSAITGEVIYVGKYDQGAGCWPISGTITQLPGDTYSHDSVDAFDIGTGGVEGAPIHAPFPGKACAYAENYVGGGLGGAIYGNHVVLASTDYGAFGFGHMSRFAFPSGSCTDVAAGEVIGYVGNTGASSGPHLHFELRDSAPRPFPTQLSLLMPDGAGIKENDPVRSCYE
jgi:murein DD-endopeptidase MepM/ murein hydrolase activator NlpD